MSILKQILIFITQIFFTFCFAQREKIDSLKKALLSLKDSAGIDCLNELAGMYLTTNYHTAALYTDLAYKQAVQIKYIHGIAESLSYRGEAELYAENFPAAEAFSRKSIYWYRQTLNKKRLADAYRNLGGAQYAQSYFTEAINSFNTAYAFYKKDNNTKGMFWCLFISGHIYGESGNYEQAFELDTKALDLAIANKDLEYQSYQLSHVAWLFEEMGDYKTAMDYHRQSYLNGIAKQDSFYYFIGNARLYTLLQQYDSAMHYYSLADTTDKRALRFYLAGIGEYFFARKEYNKALPNLLRSLRYNEEKNDRNQVMRLLMDVAKTYLAMHNNSAALKYGLQGLNLAEETGAKQFIRDGNQILYLVYEAKHRTDSAYHYYRRYIVMKDSILNDQVKAKLIAYGPKQKIELLNKEKEIQQAQLQKQSLLRNVLIGSITILLLLAAIIFRNVTLKRKNEKLESERIKAELEQQATELEMQALRTQMNPHFIFNSLNSINRFILQSNKVQASEYLTKFSKLIRMILNSSGNVSVSLAEDLEALQLYLELERLRCEQKFSFKIKCDLDIDFIQVPPMLLQPFVENAIWHGLMNLPDWQAGKEGDGHLWINIDQEDSSLICTITDNGVGRKKASALKEKSGKHKSMGMKITESRIAMLQKINGENKSVGIRDLVDTEGNAAGTEVMLRIPVVQHEI